MNLDGYEMSNCTECDASTTVSYGACERCRDARIRELESALRETADALELSILDERSACHTPGARKVLEAARKVLGK